MSVVTADNCPFPWDWAMITADGDVRPCCYGHVIGNLNASTFEEVWNGRTMLELRYAIDHNLLHTACAGAACAYAQAKARKPRDPVLDDHRCAFRDVSAQIRDGSIKIEGVVINAGDYPWQAITDAGGACIVIGGRLRDGNGVTIQEMRHNLSGAFIFPGEACEFHFSFPKMDGSTLEIGLLHENKYWFSSKGGATLSISV